MALQLKVQIARTSTISSAQSATLDIPCQIIALLAQRTYANARMAPQLDGIVQRMEQKFAHRATPDTSSTVIKDASKIETKRKFWCNASRGDFVF